MRRYTALLLIPMLVAVAMAAEGDGTTPGKLKQIVTKEETKAFTEQFLRTLIKARPYDAFALIKATMPDAEADIDANRQSTETMIETVRPTYGKMIDFELVNAKSLATSLVRYDYLVKFEKNAIHCRVIFYRPVNNWIPSSLVFYNDLSGLFEDFGK